MRIAHALIACLVLAAWTTSAQGQPAAGYAPRASGYPASPGWGQTAGYPMQGGAYPMQVAGMQQGYGMPMLQPGQYAGAGYMQQAGMQPGAAQPGEYYMAPSGQPYAAQNEAGEWVEGQSQPGAIVDAQSDFEQQMEFEPSEPPVPVPPPPQVFTWNPPPTGSSILRAMGPPYAALRDSDGCNAGLLGDWAQVIRSRVGQVYVRAEAIMLRRGNPGGSTPLFVTNLQLPNQATVLATNNLAFTNEVGQRMTIGVATSQRSAFEVTYLALQNWVTQPSATGPANLFLAGDLAGTATAFSDASFVQAVDATMLTSMEFNYLATTIFERFTFLGGFRYFDVKDSLDLNSSSPTINGLPGNGNGSLAMHTLNQLYGGQIGGVFRQNFDFFTLELWSKAGAYGNYATQNQVLVDNGQVLRDGTGARSTSSFVGDINLNGVYHFSNFVALRFGYNVMWIDRLALAPSQMNLSGFQSNGPISPAGNGINHSSNLFLYGVNLGLDARF